MSDRERSEQDFTNILVAILPWTVVSGFLLSVVAGVRFVWWMMPIQLSQIDPDSRLQVLGAMASNLWIVWLSVLHFSYAYSIEKYRKVREREQFEVVMKRRQRLWINLAISGTVYVIYRLYGDEVSS